MGVASGSAVCGRGFFVWAWLFRGQALFNPRPVKGRGLGCVGGVVSVGFAFVGVASAPEGAKPEGAGPKRATPFSLTELGGRGYVKPRPLPPPIVHCSARGGRGLGGCGRSGHAPGRGRPRPQSSSFPLRWILRIRPRRCLAVAKPLRGRFPVGRDRDPSGARTPKTPKPPKKPLRGTETTQKTPKPPKKPPKPRKKPPKKPLEKPPKTP